MTENRDVVVRVPQERWLAWLAEGDWPGEPETETWAFSVGHVSGPVAGVRCYVACYGLVRGYAPLTGVSEHGTQTSFLRRGGAVALHVPGIDVRRGRWTWRYRHWQREIEVPSTGTAWATDGLPTSVWLDVTRLIALRSNLTTRATIKARALAGATKSADLFRGLG